MRSVRRKRKDGYPYVWDRDHRPSGRRGQRCRKTGRREHGNVVGIEFMDGARFVVAEGGLKKAKEEE